MTTKEAAEKWNCKVSWVRERCKEKIIPFAEKGVVWCIPNEADKPPCTRHYATELLRRIDAVEECKNVNVFPGRDKTKLIEIYKYLANWSFITSLASPDDKYIEEMIKKAKITPLGRRLIEEEDMCKRKTITKKVGVNSGPVSWSKEVMEAK